jgi:hypothetical protein
LKTLHPEIIIPAQGGQKPSERWELGVLLSHSGSHLGKKSGFKKKVLHLLIGFLNKLPAEISKDLFGEVEIR